jgi:hypothetical protein
MSLRANCSSCNQKFNAPDNLAGKTIKCPKCGGRVTIPDGMMPAPAKPNSGIKPTRPSAIPRNSKLPQPAAPPPKKSGSKVLLFVLLGVGLLGCCGLTSGLGGAYVFFFRDRGQGSAEWREFASKEGGFKVLMPGTPDQAKKPDPKLAEDGGTVHEFVAKGVADTTYKVQFYDLKEVPLNNHLYLKDKLLAQNPDSKDPRSEQISLKEHAGIEMTADLPNEKSVTRRAYVVENRVYILSAEAPQAIAGTSEVKQFFESFALTAPPAVVQAKPKTEEPSSKITPPAPDKSKIDPDKSKIDPDKSKIDPPPPEKPNVEPKVDIPVKPGAKADTVKMSADEQKLLELLNKFRVAEKQPALKQRQRLFDEARKGADLLSKKQKWVHDAQRYGYRQIFHLTLPAPAEAATPQQLFDDLIQSKSTRRTVLDEFEDIGIGIAPGEGISYYVIIMGGNSDD